MRATALLGLILGGITLHHGSCLADGCFVFRWNKQIDINEPTQKAIILHDKGREDMVLQVKYEGPVEEFGWLVPVPELPEVRKGSMDCFYELSRLTQERGFHASTMSLSRGMSPADNSVKVIEIKTVGAYEIAILSADDATKLANWLDANGFVFPSDKKNILGSYVRRHWYFVAIKIDPGQVGFLLVNGAPKQGTVRKALEQGTRTKLANGELHPLVISFNSEKCVFPLAISAVNGKPSDISLYVLSSQALMNRVMFDKKITALRERRAAATERRSLREKAMEEQFRAMTNHSGALSRPINGSDDPADPRPDPSELNSLGGRRAFGESAGTEPSEEYDGVPPLFQALEVGPMDLKSCAKELPRLAGKSWYLVKQVEVFEADEMVDLEFDPALPALENVLHTENSYAAGNCLPQFGKLSVPIILAAANGPDIRERRSVASCLEMIQDSRIAAVVPDLLTNSDSRIRRGACYAAANDWNDGFALPLVKMLTDEDGYVRSAACFVLSQHPDRKLIPICKKIVEQDVAGSAQAFRLLDAKSFSRDELCHLLTSTNDPVVMMALSRLQGSLTVSELAPLLTNSLPFARLCGLGELRRIGDEAAIDKIVSMLHDTDNFVAWSVRSTLRRLFCQKLGADPAAYEKCWAANR